MAEPYQRVCPPRAPSARSPSLPVAPSWVSTPLPSAPQSDGWLACSSPSPAPRLILVAPPPLVGALPSAPLPDVLCYDPAYENAELVLTCGACYDGIDIVVPAGQFISRVSQADADAQAQAWGESQLSCLPADPASIIPNWDDLSGDVAITQIDVYGLKGFEAYAIAGAESAGRMWCTFEPALDFCDGPDVEGIPNQYVYDRWSVRWVVEMADGEFSYGKVGGQLLPAPVELFPSPVSGAIGVSLSFDANARPCFAFQVGDSVEVRRFIAGLPVTYSWPGQGPKLFFNGLLQRDSGLRDLVCYYINAGKLYARLQRDNFGVEYVLMDHTSTAGLGALSKVSKVDRGSAEDASRNWLAAMGADGGFLLLRSAPYPPWPVLAQDSCDILTALSGSGDYELVAVESGPYSDSETITLGLGEGDYQALVVTIAEASALAASVALSGSGDYGLVVVGSGPYADSQTATAGLSGSGDYALVVILGGTYSDSTTITLGLDTGDYTLA